MENNAHPERRRLRNVGELLRLFEPVIQNISNLAWKPRDGFWFLLCRCVLRRQYDSLKAIVDLCARAQAQAAIPLLRPACEEQLWVAFLARIDRERREQFLLSKSQIEIAASLDAQIAAAGEENMRTFGFTDKFVEHIRRNSKAAQEDLKQIAKDLGWRLPRGQYLPSTRFVAEKTNNVDFYALIYHASSRTVHFSVHELLRRAWGTSDHAAVEYSSVSISSDEMNGYWGEFSLYWGWRIFFFTFVEIAELFEQAAIPMQNFEDESFFESLMANFAEPGQVPIITAHELNLHLPSVRSTFR